MQEIPVVMDESAQYVAETDLAALRHVNVRAVDLDQLIDIREITIDETLPREQRMAEYIRQVKNPYCFRVGKVAVSVGFSQDGVTFGQRMEHYLKTL